MRLSTHSENLTNDEPRRSRELFVVTSELRVPDEGVDVLTEAFRDRIGLVDDRAGFDRLEVWQDVRDVSRFVMTSWWHAEEDFRSYMRSDDHRRSHDRVPDGAARPRAVAVRRHRVVST